jgi:hypothetical protein
MDSMMALNARVGACRLLLEQHEEGSAIHKSLSSLQSAAICEMIAATVMTADISSAVGTRVVQVKWGSPEDCNAILAALSASSKSLVLPAGKRRRMQQDYRNIVHYGSAMLWEQLQDSSVPGSSKLNLILNLAVVLGCRCPSEHTVKLVCSFWLLVAESEEGLLKMSLDQKKVMLMHVKQTFQGLLKAAADPPQFIMLLPLPLIFLRDHAIMYHVAFTGGQVPAPTCIDMKALTALDLSYSCRGGVKSVVHLGGSMPSSSSSASSSSGRRAVSLRRLAFRTDGKYIHEPHRVNGKPTATNDGDHGGWRHGTCQQCPPFPSGSCEWRCCIISSQGACLCLRFTAGFARQCTCCTAGRSDTAT